MTKEKNTKSIMKGNHIKELQHQQEELIKKAINIDDKIKTIEEQGSLGTEISNVYMDSVVDTFPFGARLDPFNKYDVGGFRKKPTLLSHKLLRSLAKRVEPVAAIIGLRCNQVGAFSHVSSDKDVAGFHIVLKDEKAVPTPEQRKEMKLIEDFFENTGFTFNPTRNDNFEQYQKKIVRDRLTLDAITTQFVANKKGQITEFWAMDAGTIHFATDQYHPKRGETYQPIAYVQELDGQILGEFTALELAYGVCNPSTSLLNYGYGESELELLIEIITSYLFSREYNKTFFTKNSVPPGIMTLIGDYKEEEIQMFRRQWSAQVQGVANAFRVPVVVSKEGKGAEFKQLKTNQKDAEFMKWLDFLIRITAAIYQTSPEEINFSMGASGSESPLVAREGGQQILNSKDKGLVPLLRFLQGYYNTNFVGRFNPLFKFEYTGIELKDKDRDIDRKKKKSFFMTLNEIRKEDDLDPLDINKIDNIFDLPDNPVIQQAWLQMREATMGPDLEEGGIPPAGGEQGVMQTQGEVPPEEQIPMEDFPQGLESKMAAAEQEDEIDFPPELDAEQQKQDESKQKEQEDKMREKTSQNPENKLSKKISGFLKGN